MTESQQCDPFKPDGLRPPEYVCSPDPRTHMFIIQNEETGHSKPIAQYDQYEAVSRYDISVAVPENVRTLFDTARNLYLYAWFIYRFYNIAEQQVFACLEMALRERLRDEFPLPESYWPKKKKKQMPSIKPMLRYVIDKGYIHNEGFRAWRERGEIRARQRYEIEKIQEMDEKGLESMELDYSDVVITDQDREDYDYLQVLLNYIADARNNYAHGSGLLHNQVLHSFEVVSELINQLFKDN